MYTPTARYRTANGEARWKSFLVSVFLDPDSNVLDARSHALLLAKSWGDGPGQVLARQLPIGARREIRKIRDPHHKRAGGELSPARRALRGGEWEASART